MILRALGLLIALTSFGLCSSDLADRAESGDWKTVSVLAAQGAAIDAPQADGMTALLWAAYYDRPDEVKLLLDAGADACLANAYEVSPLSLACRNGNGAVVRMLLRAGANPKARLIGGETALMTAARTGRVECVRALIDAGVDVDATERKGQTALMWAASEGHAEVVRALIDAGAETEKSLKSGFSPVFFAIRAGHGEVAKILLESGIDVNVVARPRKPGGRSMRAGTSPLMLAVENGHLELAIELLELGADPNDQRSGYTPLHAITWVRKSPKGDGADGIPPPEITGEIGSLEFIRTLVARGADVNSQVNDWKGGNGKLNLKGATPFLMAAHTDDLPMLKLLVELGADSAIPNSRGTMPLLAAAGVGVIAPGEEPGTEDEAIETVNYLLELGANVNSVNSRGETAMHGAAYKALPRLATLLDEKGADINVWNKKNKNGWTPLLIGQGYRFGNYRPIKKTVDAISKLMKQHGVEPPAPPQR